mmetsp:Transcript_72899/g.193638  ORF Transcript_72899/g.193638 Transcript_72899/m.193638 type:complete len:259 (-) Transcript_72899:112-888(-)
MSSWNSACSFLRCSVASVTDLSNSAIPASNAAISEARVAMPSLAAAMAPSSSETVRSKDFFLSSLKSNCSLQYSFLWSSSSCSVLSTSTMPSIILMTLSKPPLPAAFRLVKANTRRSRPVRSCGLRAPAAVRKAAKACWRLAVLPAATWTKLALALGNVFLNSSIASSSFNTLIVSASATSSSALVFFRSSHSAAFVAQLFSKPARNFLSSARAASVSERSSFMFTIATPNSPICFVLDSMDPVSATTSFVLAAMSSS